MTHEFDEFTKTLAGGVSRRQALRSLAGLLAGAWAASLALGGQAHADDHSRPRPRGPGGGVLCGRVQCKQGEVCCDPTMSACAKHRGACV
jgi:hypothetical protein